MDTQLTKSHALIFSQCAVFYCFTSPPGLGVHFHCPVSLAPGTSLGRRSAACAMCSVNSPISQLQIGANVAHYSCD